MKNETNEILNGMLADWHRWARGYQHVGGINSSPMFRHAKSSRGWQTTDEILRDEVEHDQMEALDNIIMAMPENYRTALQIQARNLFTGRSVWTSDRLPQDLEARALILAEARIELTRKLTDAGIL